MRLEYKVYGSLTDALSVAYEIRSITGMEPGAVVLNDEQKVRFAYGDFRLLRSGDIDEKEYIVRNSIC